MQKARNISILRAVLNNIYWYILEDSFNLVFTIIELN